MPSQRVVVIGASSGGVEALINLAGALPADFGAPIFVVIHVAPNSRSLLPELLSRRGNLPAKHPADGERYQPGHIYVAPPNQHLLIARNGTVHLRRGPRENRNRPAIDPLFRSAALLAGPNAIAVVLTGSLDDGTAGLLAVKRRGGKAIVQDPREAMYPSMPESALENVDVDFSLPLGDIARKLVELVGTGADFSTHAAADLQRMEIENRIAAMDRETMQRDDRPGKPFPFSCPDCGGVLWEIEDGQSTRFRCRVGGAFSHESMLEAQNEKLEAALRIALKTLREKARLSKGLAEAQRVRKHDWMAARFEEQERDARERADVIQRFLLTGTSELPQGAAGEVEQIARRR